MEETFNVIQNTPIPTILIMAGLFFLLLGFVNKLGGIIEVSPEHKRWTIPLGLLILVIGLVLNFIHTPDSNTSIMNSNKPERPVIQGSEAKPSTDIENSQYVIDVYACSGRENDGKRAEKALEENGYIVNIRSGCDFVKKGTVKSYIYFKDNDHKEVLVVRDILSRTLDEDFDVNLAARGRIDKAMRVILVDKNS